MTFCYISTEKAITQIGSLTILKKAHTIELSKSAGR